LRLCHRIEFRRYRAKLMTCCEGALVSNNKGVPQPAPVLPT
jgi:hypothetical protein